MSCLCRYFPIFSFPIYWLVTVLSHLLGVHKTMNAHTHRRQWIFFIKLKYERSILWWYRSIDGDLLVLFWLGYDARWMKWKKIKEMNKFWNWTVVQVQFKQKHRLISKNQSNRIGRRKYFEIAMVQKSTDLDRDFWHHRMRANEQTQRTLRMGQLEL